MKPATLDLSRPWLSEATLAWPVMGSVDLKPEQAVGIKAFGLPLLLIRGSEGSVSVHLDRCPHRHVSFFSGPKQPKVEGGTIRCPFHHQTFDQEGHCVKTLHGEAGGSQRLLTLPSLEQHGFIWLPMARNLFDEKGHLSLSTEQLAAAEQGLRLPAEFEHLNNEQEFHCLPLYEYRYANGPWGLTITSAIDHTHGFQVHGIAKAVHRLRRWTGQETLSGMHMACSDEERSVLVTYEQLKDELKAYWKVGGAPNLWLNKLDHGLYIAVLFVPEDSAATMTRGYLYVNPRSWGGLEFAPLLKGLRDLSIQNSEEDRPFIESQAEHLKAGEIPIGNSSLNDAPVYRFFRYLEEMTATPIDFGFVKSTPYELIVRNFWSS